LTAGRIIFFLKFDPLLADHNVQEVFSLVRYTEL
jgi:hypothetical protein